MRHLYALAVFALFLVGCDAPKIQVAEFGESTVSDRYANLRIDKENQIFSAVDDNTGETRWASYRFYGDTLAVFWHHYMDCPENEDELNYGNFSCDYINGLLLTGGTAGNLDGYWTVLPMSIHLEDMGLVQYEFQRERAKVEPSLDLGYVYYSSVEKTKFNFMDGSLEVLKFDKMQAAPEFVFSKSLFMYEIYTYLGSRMIDRNDSLRSLADDKGIFYPIEWYGTFYMTEFPVNIVMSTYEYLTIDSVMADLDVKVKTNSNSELKMTGSIMGVDLEVEALDAMVYGLGTYTTRHGYGYFAEGLSSGVKIMFNGTECAIAGLDVSPETFADALKYCLDDALEKWSLR